MGLSSSQARLLNLTARMHDIEYKAQNLEAQKLQMANESRQVYTEYENALNKQKVQFKQIGADGAASYVNADLQTLLKAGYHIKINVNNKWYQFAGTAGADGTYTNLPTGTNVTEDKQFKPGSYTKGTVSTAKDNNTYVIAETKTISSDGNIQVYKETALKALWKNDSAPTETTDIDVIYKLLNINFDDKETLMNLVEAGFIVFEKPTTEKNPDGTTKYAEVNIATDTSLQEVSDELDLKKAEAKYEADMRKIDAKDKKFDTDLAALEQERNAIKTEMDTLKTVAKDNVDRTFKLFS